MTEELIGIPDEVVLSKIYLIRGQKVMLDKDIAELYGVETKRLMEQVRRNLSRFPEKYMFTLTKEESDSLRSQFATLEKGKHSKYLTTVFSEHGILQLSNVLKSARAIEVSFRIIDVFVKIREMLTNNVSLQLEIEHIKNRLNSQDKNVEVVFQYLDELLEKKDQPNPQRKSIGYEICKKN